MPPQSFHISCMIHRRARHTTRDCPEVVMTTRVLTEAWWDYERDGRRLPSRVEVRQEVRRRLNRERNRRLRTRRLDERRRRERLAAETQVKSEESSQKKTIEETNENVESKKGETDQGNTLTS